MVDVHGTVAPGYERVRDAFVANFEAHGDVGAAVCVRVAGDVVVDLWGGLADPYTGRPWDAGSLQLVFSLTKGITTILVLRLAEAGLVDLDAPVARHWPEFGAHGKDRVTVREALAHRAGVPAIDGEFTLDQALSWDTMTAALAAQAPEWEPGTNHGYHVRTWGWLAGEVVRRVTGESPGRALARWVTGPLGVDFHLGLPAALEPRVTRVLPPEGGVDLAALLGADSLTARALSTPGGVLTYDESWNERRLHAAELPSSNGIGTARAVATIYAATIGDVDGVRLLSDATVADAAEPVSDGPDAVLMLPSRYGTGFSLPPILCPPCPASCFGHAGAGGSLGFADPEAGVAFGYVMNRMKLAIEEDRRTSDLVRAVYEARTARG